jgi:hypothetical protein
VAGKKVPTRKVPTISAEARQFIEQGATHQAPKMSDPQAPKMPDPQETKGPGVRGVTARALVERADGRTLRRIQIYFDADVAKRLRHHCVEHDVDMSAYVNSLVDQALSK